MAAKGYQYYLVNTFPEWEIGEEFETIHQDALFPEMVDEGPKSIIKLVGLSDHSAFQKYHVLHETFRSVRGRYQNKPINGYISQEEFHLFRHSSKRILLMDTTLKNCKEIVDRLERANIEFFVTSQNIDLIKLGDDLRARIRGGWFGDLKVADVSSIGLFGPTVGESTEWGRYEQIGELKAIDIELTTKMQKLLVKIMANRGVVLFSPFTEMEALDMLLEIQDVLNPFVIKN